MTPDKLPHDHGTNTLELIKIVPKVHTFEEVSDSFALISDSTRLKIFWLLCHSEDCVVNIAAAVGMSSPATSHHLRVLKQAKLITSSKKGKEVHYKIADTSEAELLHKSIDSLLEIKCPGQSNFTNENY